MTDNNNNTVESTYPPVDPIEALTRLCRTYGDLTSQQFYLAVTSQLPKASLTLDLLYGGPPFKKILEGRTPASLVAIGDFFLLTSVLAQIEPRYYSISSDGRCMVNSANYLTNLIKFKNQKITSECLTTPITKHNFTTFAVPRSFQVDFDGRISCEEGPAVEYKAFPGVLDSHRITYAIAGVVVPSWVVKDPTGNHLDSIGRINNMEARRIAIERCAGHDQPPVEGWKRFLVSGKTTILDRRINDVEYTEELLVQSRYLPQAHILVASCKTGRMFCMMVPKTVDTCVKAQEWLSGYDPKLPPRLVGPKPISIGRS